MPPVAEFILSLPPQMCPQLAECEPEIAARAFAVHDPPATQLGSGGGTAHALHQAWQAEGGADSLAAWIAARQRILIHGGGESRRLPAYAAAGKLFIPMPALRWARGQRLGQTLLELNEPFLRDSLAAGGPNPRLLVASGDVLLRSAVPVTQLPEADVVILGMWAPPEQAQHYGVLFVDAQHPERLLTFLQKPSPDEIRERSRSSAFLIDVGAWLLSPRAVRCLLAKCGWDEARGEFTGGTGPAPYDLYGQWALSLGAAPELPDAEVAELSVAAGPIGQGEFYHFGAAADVVTSNYALQNLVSDQTMLGTVPSLAQPQQFIQDALFGAPVRLAQNEHLWVENSCIPATWRLAKRHMLTGVPRNAWQLELPAGTCLDFVPIDEQGWAVRCYGYADRFRGPLADPEVAWMERPARQWFAQRAITWEQAGLDPALDIQRAPLFPLVGPEQLTEELIAWMIAPEGSGDHAALRRLWLETPRLSARQIAQRANLPRIYRQRIAYRREVLPLMATHAAKSVFYKLDLIDAARGFAAADAPLPEPLDPSDDLMLAVHNRMFRSEVQRCRGEDHWEQDEAASFRLLADAIVAPYRQTPVRPEFRLHDDQIVWGRSPVRVDLAGGWTDTPPFCLQHGGSVVNVALDLNGQPPIQAYARRCVDRTLTIRSIDLGISETLASYDEVGGYRGLGSGFSVAKAALALCGFHPEFNGGAFPTLAAQLDQFGGGIDLSMLSAVPKGSGLGASSILSATVLGTLSELCGFGWNHQQIAARVSAVEQMLGSGGGWQDQFGGILPGAKLLQSAPGLDQQVSIRWLPGEFFSAAEYRERVLLYYTGITRVAHDVLREIVRGMFLNAPGRLAALEAIGQNSRTCFDAAQRCDFAAFARTIDRSWQLNQQIDSGTNPAEVAEVVDRAAPHATALKLAGAGGGGFLYVIARDAESARALRAELEAEPTNPRARFFEASVSGDGLRVTRS